MQESSATSSAGAPLAEIESPTEAEENKTMAVSGTGEAVGAVPTRVAWDPLACADWDRVPAQSSCLSRIQRDLMSLYKDPPHGIFVVPDENNLCLLHALVIGPYDTPYEGGFFHLVVRCPADYPIRPPRVRLLTTADDTVRFNPNLYRNGKVCLSILGTWTGPSWTPSQSLTSILVSIQSLMNENPYHNEPGFEKEHASGDSDRYNAIIAHETVRVAVCQQLEASSTGLRTCPESLRDMMRASFPQFYEHYTSVCHKQISKGLQNQRMVDPFGEKRGTFDPQGLLQRLKILHQQIPHETEDQAAASSSSPDTL